MKNYLWSIAIILFVSLCMTSCTEDSLLLNADEIANESTTHHIHSRNCKTHEHTDGLIQDPAYREAREKRIADFEKSKTSLDFRAPCSTPTVLPVAVHYQGVGSPNAACLLALAQSQVDILNADYSGTNSDISQWNGVSQYFPGTAKGETCIQFVLADKNHPSGFGLSDGQQAVTINKVNGDQSNAWSGYLNIFVIPNTGYLGYSPFGGSGNGDGVVIDASAFGSGSGCSGVAPQSPYNLGRTLTHELGHYLYLDHVWGNNGGCNDDDGVSDTPNQAQDSAGCPNVPSSSCNSNDLSMNYMDYVNDQCMYMFSAGQSQRMENYVNASLQNLVNNLSNVYSGSTNGGGGNGGGDPNDTCEKPSSLSTVSLSPTSEKITWSAETGATKYRLKYRKVGGSWTTKTKTTNEHTATGLQANTTYQYKVRAQCPSGWTAFSAVSTFTTDDNGGGGNNGCADIKIKIFFDDYPEETSWELVDDGGATIVSGGNYGSNKAGGTATKTECLEDGCYTLYVDDAYGDGICCDYGNGKVQIRANGQVIASSNGDFGFYTAIDFCLVNGSAARIGVKADNKAKGLKIKASRSK